MGHPEHGLCILASISTLRPVDIGHSRNDGANPAPLHMRPKCRTQIAEGNRINTPLTLYLAGAFPCLLPKGSRHRCFLHRAYAGQTSFRGIFAQPGQFRFKFAERFCSRLHIAHLHCSSCTLPAFGSSATRDTAESLEIRLTCAPGVHK